MKKNIIGFLLALTGLTFSCNNYLDVVPDSVATIENAFTLRSSAEKYLFTCFSYMPEHGHFNDNPGFSAADEVWYPTPPMDVDLDFLNIQRGLQNSSNPLGNFWSGENQGKPLFQGLRDCNIFLDNIHKVKELDSWERDWWSAEVKFLKAYYHFYLMRMYGPIPLIRENLPISASPEEVQSYREPVDEVVEYIIGLLDEVLESQALPDRIMGTENTEMGRITNVIVKALKAKVLVTAASPLFNGNPEYANFKDNRGKQLISSVYDQGKWEKAALACREAINFADSLGYRLYRFPGNNWAYNDTIKQQLDLRMAFTDKEFNTEVIWPNTTSMADVNFQRWSMPIIASGATSGSGPKGLLSPTNKMLELFYSENGVPITEDKDWDYTDRYTITEATHADRFYIREGEKTVNLHFNREPRFYAFVGFDRGIWYGNWVNNYDTTDVYYVMARAAEISARQGISNYSITGNWPKKLVNVETSCAADGNITSNIVTYPWPELRLTDLYLLYSEALNEVNGYSPETTYWINKVRERAGLSTIEDAWTQHSTDPTKYQSKEGLREIIHQERSIELMFEGQRYWDLKRWKKAHLVLNQPIKAWDITQKSAVGYYSEILLANQRFQMRDYLWPIELDELQINRNLVQNPGW